MTDRKFTIIFSKCPLNVAHIKRWPDHSIRINLWYSWCPNNGASYKTKPPCCPKATKATLDQWERSNWLINQSESRFSAATSLARFVRWSEGKAQIKRERTPTLTTLVIVLWTKFFERNLTASNKFANLFVQLRLLDLILMEWCGLLPRSVPMALLVSNYPTILQQA